MADGTAFGDKLDRRKMQFGTLAIALFGIGAFIIFRRTGLRQQDRRHQKRHLDSPGPPWRRVTLVLGVEEMPDHRPHHQHQRQDHPRIVGRENGRVMATDHHKDHRQGQIIIMQGALFATPPENRVGRVTGNQRRNDFLLPGDDHHGDIRHHDSADADPDLHKGAARREYLGIEQGQRDNEDETGQR